MQLRFNSRPFRFAMKEEMTRLVPKAWNVNRVERLSPIDNRQWESSMKVTTIGLATALMLSSAAAFAQGAGGASGSAGSAASSGVSGTGTSTSPGVNTGTGTTTGMGNNGVSNQAGSAAAGANSAQNPSGNTYLNNTVPGMSGPTGGPSRR